MQDAHALAPHLEHVEIAIGIEGIAHVVAGDHHVDARVAEFVQRGDAAPARRAAGLAVLQEEVAHRQRNDAEPGARRGLDRPFALVVVLDCERTAVADQDAPGKAALERRLGDDAQRPGLRIGGFVDMEVEVPALALGEREQGDEAVAEFGDHEGDRAEDAGPVRLEHRFDVGHVRGVEREVDLEQRRGLKLDAAFPALARLRRAPAS